MDLLLGNTGGEGLAHTTGPPVPRFGHCYCYGSNIHHSSLVDVRMRLLM